MTEELRECEECLQALPASAYYAHRKTLFSSPLCKKCTCADNKLRREHPEQQKLAQEQRVAKREAKKAAFEASVTEKACTHCQTVKPMDDFRVHRGLYGRSSWCLSCEKQDKERWLEQVDENGIVRRDSFNAKRRETWAANPLSPEDKLAAAERAREWYANNTERAKATQKAYFLKHSSEILEYIKQWQKANPEKVKKYIKKCLTNNPEHARIQDARRKAVYLKGDFTYDQWEEILEQFNYCCAYCLNPSDNLTMDHMEPISKDGPHTRDNVIPACGPCNSTKKNRSIFVMLPKVAQGR